VKLKQLSNDQKSFGSALKRLLCVNSFYSMEEYFNYKINFISEHRHCIIHAYSIPFNVYNVSLSVFYVHDVGQMQCCTTVQTYMTVTTSTGM
jgi:hypothetical protein